MRYSPYLLIFISSHYRMTRILIVLSSASLLISSFPFGGEFNGNQPSFPSYGGDFNGNKVDGIDGGFAPITSIGGGEGTFPGQGEINGGSGGFFVCSSIFPPSSFFSFSGFIHCQSLFSVPRYRFLLQAFRCRSGRIWKDSHGERSQLRERDDL